MPGELCRYAEKKMGGFVEEERRKKMSFGIPFPNCPPERRYKILPVFWEPSSCCGKKTTLSCALFKFRFLCPVF